MSLVQFEKPMKMVLKSGIVVCLVLFFMEHVATVLELEQTYHISFALTLAEKFLSKHAVWIGTYIAKISGLLDFLTCLRRIFNLYTLWQSFVNVMTAATNLCLLPLWNFLVGYYEYTKTYVTPCAIPLGSFLISVVIMGLFTRLKCGHWPSYVECQLFINDKLQKWQNWINQPPRSADPDSFVPRDSLYHKQNY